MSVSTVVNHTPVTSEHWSVDQKELIKRTICIGITDDELLLFSHVCKKTGLDPFCKQIYAVKRKTKHGDMMTIQTGIDGYRLIADRSERYAPGQKPTYVYSKEGQLIAATAYVKKMTKDGTWHVVEAEAAFSEYCQTNQYGQPAQMWAKIPRVMLAKCAEALALKKAFPAELSGIYTDAEMGQADNPTTLDVTASSKSVAPEQISAKNTVAPSQIAYITKEQIAELERIIPDVPKETMDATWSVLKTHKQNKLSEVPASEFVRLRDHLLNSRRVK